MNSVCTISQQKTNNGKDGLKASGQGAWDGSCGHVDAAMGKHSSSIFDFGDPVAWNCIISDRHDG